jgi:predicted O-methyltransferase YrrM
MATSDSGESGSAADDPDRVPPEINTGVAHPARIYDYLLGGKDNFAADRAVADAVAKAMPSARAMVRANRDFLGRAVHYLVTEAGVRQFLDIGTGIPTAGNTHEVAQAAAPQSRVVYVDNDPIVLAHARALMTSDPAGAPAFIQADLQDPDKILDDPALRRTLDLGEPVALMLIDPRRAGPRPPPGQVGGQ